jgi:hypothetical protein
MRLSVVKKIMTSFKLSDATRAQITRIREARNEVHTPAFWRAKLNNTDVIRQLAQEECNRLDAASKIAADAPKQTKKINGVKSKKSTTKSKGK